MDWQNLRGNLGGNLLPAAGLMALGAASIWFLESVTPWLDGLPFSPWWLVAAVVALGTVLLVLVARLGLSWDTTETDLALAGACGLVAGSAANIALGLWLKPWLEGLSFNPWWLALIAIPVAVVGFGLALVFAEEDEAIDLRKFSVYGPLLSLLGMGLVAANVALAFWLNSWLAELPFNPWWLLVPVSLLSLFLVLLSMYSELLAWLLPIVAILLLAPVILVTSVLWLPVLVIWAALSEGELEEQEDEALSAEGVWTDHEIQDIADDSFHFQDYAEALADRAQKAGMPLVIGIFGRWGSGKTSLMRLMERLLEEKPHLETLWINVWQLSNREQLWNAFLQALLTRVQQQLSWRRRLALDWYLFRRRVRWGKLAQTLLANSYRALIAVTPLLLAVLLPDQTGNDTGQVVDLALNPIAAGTASLVLGLWLVIRPAVEAARETVSLDLDEVLEEAPYEFQVSVLEQMREDFQEMVRMWVGPQGRLVVFIDDLDRCSPDNIVEVFEALKLFTTANNCVYVMGVDYDVVRDAIKAKYDISTAEAAEYLEKVLQIPFHLPPLEDDRIADFVKENYPDVLGECESAPEVFSLGLEPNPRKVKRALNVYRTVHNLAEERWWNWDMDHEVVPELVAKIVVVQSRFPALHRALIRSPSLICALDGWARQFTNEKTSGHDAVRDAAAKKAHDQIAELVPERDQRALASMLCAGSHCFDELEQANANVYIYLTSTGQETAEGTRPRREERGLLLAGEEDTIADVVGEILQRGQDPEQQQEITARYLERLKGVIIPPERYAVRWRFTVEERESANVALKQLRGIGLPRPYEPQTVWVPAGCFLMGYTDDDIRLLANVGFDMHYGQLLEQVGEDDMELRTFVEGLLEELHTLAKRLPEEEWETLHWMPEQMYDGLLRRREARKRQPQEEGKAEPESPWELELGEFFIGHHPVTNAEYLAFVRETNREPPAHMADEAVIALNSEYWPVRDDWFNGSALPPIAYHPVVGVSWHDAIAYCAWLSEATGRFYRLPTEPEWEKAARGVHAGIFPWGNAFEPQRCNMSALREATTTQVLTYDDHSPYLAQDTVGNVWEWTQSLYQSYPYRTGEEREDVDAEGDRVLRGGSFIDLFGAVSCATRHHARPGLKLKNVGFRVAMLPSGQ